MDKKAARKQVEAVLTGFDFNIVLAYMKTNGWKYSGIKGTPTIDDLKSMARSVLSNAIESDRYPEDHRAVSCDGFEARIYKWGKSKTILELTFRIESSSAYFE